MGRVWRVLDERDTGLPQRDKRGRKWGEIGVKGEKERTHPGFVCHAITDGESQTAGCGGGGEQGDDGMLEGGKRRRREARKVLWLLVSLSLTKGRRRIPILL